MTYEIISGKNPVLEALKAGRNFQQVLISQQLNKQTQQEVMRAFKQKSIPFKTVPKQTLDQLNVGQHQGIVAYVAPYEYVSLNRLFKIAKQRNEQPFFIVLDELEDPHNLGSILRSAEATGVHGVIIPKHRSVGLNATVAKTSAGAIEYVPVVQVTNLVDTLNELKDRHVWVVGTDAKSAGAEDYRSLDGETAMALVIGSEGKGMSRLVKETCDWSVFLPMIGEITSLNASVACSLLLYEIYRKRYPLEM